jgi:hypothetical protein
VTPLKPEQNNSWNSFRRLIIWETRNSYTTLVGKPLGGRPRTRWENNNIEMFLREDER